jgi:hypothetical protein
MAEDDVVAVDGRWMVIIVDGSKRIDSLLAYFKQPQYEIAVSTQSYSDPDNTTLYTIKDKGDARRREKTRG